MARVIPMNERLWGNWHGTVSKVPIGERYELHNSSSGDVIARMAAAGHEVQKLVGRAFAERRRLRAVGGAWSFSDVAAVPGGWALSTGFANRLVQVPPGDIVPAYAGDRDGLFLLQTGVSVGELNMAIERRGRSLLTSGASNGQTFVGAAATGTHGSAIDQPGIQGHVRALQLIPAPDRNLWIEPASRPLTDGRLARDLGATLVRDDRLFEAVLVGLGAFGVIHALVVQTAPRFLLSARRDRVPLTTGVEAAMRGERYDQLEQFPRLLNR
jgi:FAD binding domain